MKPIADVPGITGANLDLFKAAGMTTIDEFLTQRVAEVLVRLEKANAKDRLVERMPSRVAIGAWQDAARILDHRRSGSTTVELTPEAMRQAREPASVQPPPSATVVSESRLRDIGVDVEAVPMAKVVTGDKPAFRPKRRTKPITPEMPAPEAPEQASPAPDPAPQKKAAKDGNPPAAAPVGGTVDELRPKPKPKPKAKPPRRERPPTPAPAGGASAPREAPAASEEAPEGDVNSFKNLEAIRREKRQGERRNRGMSHPDAFRVRLAAVILVMGNLSCIATVIGLATALILARYGKWEFPPLLALLLLVFPIYFFLYLGVVSKARCRLCGQKLFVPKACRKHERASRSLFGYTFAVARNAMFVASYRCQYCGTKTRLRD